MNFKLLFHSFFLFVRSFICFSQTARNEQSFQSKNTINFHLRISQRNFRSFSEMNETVEILQYFLWFFNESNERNRRRGLNMTAVQNSRAFPRILETNVECNSSIGFADHTRCETKVWQRVQHFIKYYLAISTLQTAYCIESLWNVAARGARRFVWTSLGLGRNRAT